MKTNNEGRSARALSALMHHINYHGKTSKLELDVQQEDIAEHLSNLMHLCKSNGFDFKGMLCAAEDQFHEESVKESGRPLYCVSIDSASGDYIGRDGAYIPGSLQNPQLHNVARFDTKDEAAEFATHHIGARGWSIDLVY